MIELLIEMPDGAFSALRKSPADFALELRLAAAAKWYEMGVVSQEKAAEIAGLRRSEFVFALSRFGVSALQYSPEELREEVERG